MPYKPDEVNTLFDQLDKKDNLALYKYSEITVDLAFPICYAILLTGLINWLRHNQPLWIKRMPLFALVADLSENTIIFLMATAPDEINQLVATIAALTTLVKWSALLLILVIILSQLVFRLKDLKRFKDSDTIDKYIPSG